ncbi:MAG: DUF4421 family protein [Bacteroidales bacterium]|nr:DUF4421 family protein [Bacteroidales bacterium]MBN2748888.1 DUF4421 family protein [Bacteroidales bacterium]
MFLRRFVLALVACICFFGASAKNLGVLEADSLFIRPYPWKYSARFFSSTRIIDFSLSNGFEKGNAKVETIYKPNNIFAIGASVSYKNLVLSYAWSTPFSLRKTSYYGKTSIKDFNVNLTQRFGVLSFYYRNFKGFYIANAPDIIESWVKGSPQPLRPDADFITIGGSILVNFNPKRYSLNAAIKQTELQVQDAWAPLLLAEYSDNSFAGDSSLIPSTVKSLFFEGEPINRVTYKGISVLPGASYFVNFNGFFLNPMLFAGPGYFEKGYKHSPGNSSYEKDFSIKTSIRVHSGYNYKRYTMGVVFNHEQIFIPDGHFSFRSGVTYLSFSAGLRF